MSKVSPTQRSLKYLRNNGYLAQVVEKFNMFVHIRIDLFGCIDIVAIKDGEVGVTGIQTTSASNFSAHLKKIKAIPEIKVWLNSKNRLVLHGWRKNSKGRWVLKEQDISPKDII